MEASTFVEMGKAFGVAGVILFSLGIGGWRIMQRLMPKFEQFFDDHHMLVVSLRDALSQFGIRMTIIDERTAAHAADLEVVKDSVLRIESKIK